MGKKFFVIAFICMQTSIFISKAEDLDLDVLELLGLPERQNELKGVPSSLGNSASRFLRQVYSEIQEETSHDHQHRKYRRKRSHPEDDNFITEFDRLEIEKCNNFITFASMTAPDPITDDHLHIYFNTNNVPKDLHLVHSTLRIYHEPANGKLASRKLENVSISIYEKITYRYGNNEEFNHIRILNSINMTTMYKGWLEFNMTRLLSKWLKYRKFRNAIHGNELLLDVTTDEGHRSSSDLKISDFGFIHSSGGNVTNERSPFMIGYFNGPQLVEKMQKLRTKREILKRTRKINPHFLPPGINTLHLRYDYELPRTCQRLNFTVNFKDTHMDSWIIAPKKFEAYFCGGECNFPLGSQMNATNHAIVQNLMQLKQPHLPKPCCAPTILESITILHFLNEDNVNLVKFPQSVVKECGCH